MILGRNASQFLWYAVSWMLPSAYNMWYNLVYHSMTSSLGFKLKMGYAKSVTRDLWLSFNRMSLQNDGKVYAYYCVSFIIGRNMGM